MKYHFSRRRFLMGTAALAGSMVLEACGNETVSAISDAVYRVVETNKVYYPPLLNGLRGDHDGSQTAAHSLVFTKKPLTLPKEVEEYYDLVVVGAGLSGLTAAYLYQKAKPDAKILILDNHDDFGGHAKRNEFIVDGKKLITYGGSESLDSPKTSFSKEVHALLKELGVDYTKFHHYFQQDLYAKKWGLERGTFFNKTAFGQDSVVAGDLDKLTGAAAAEVIARFPLPSEDKLALTMLYTSPRDYFAGKTQAQKDRLAERISYYDFLKNYAHMPEKALLYLQNLSSDYWGHAINAVSVAEALENGYPGLEKLGLSIEKEEKEPYIYHFPDGNASVARLLVRKLIPKVAAGSTMEDIVTAQFDYAQLDKPEHKIRIRLNSTALMMENNTEGVAVTYLKRGSEGMKKVQAKQCIFAGHSALAARIMPQMPEEQKKAMKTNVKIPMVYAKVAVKNSIVFQKLGVYFLYMPAAPYCLLQLDDPVNIGEYRHAVTPDEPVVLHVSRIATAFEGKTSRDMYRAGRAQLLSQDYASLERELREQLGALYALAGESFDDAVVSITLNRWAHGYSYEQGQLWDSDNTMQQTTARMQRRLGNIFMAGSDVGWMPYVQGAIDQAHRAVQEVLAS